MEVSLAGRGHVDLQRKLKALDGKALKRKYAKALREEAAPLIPIVQDAARSRLPRRGGLAERVADSPVKVRVTQNGVQLVAKEGGQANRGKVRHPVFGSDTWVTQDVDPGWFDETLTKHAPDVLPALVVVTDKFLGEVADA